MEPIGDVCAITHAKFETVYLALKIKKIAISLKASLNNQLLHYLALTGLTVWFIISYQFLSCQ